MRIFRCGGRPAPALCRKPETKGFLRKQSTHWLRKKQKQAQNNSFGEKSIDPKRNYIAVKWKSIGLTRDRIDLKRNSTGI
jgi:hypothetical protein